MIQISDYLAMVLLYIFVVHRKIRTLSVKRRFTAFLFYLYLCILFTFTLSPFIPSLPGLFHHGPYSFNLIPYIDLLKGYGDFDRQIVLNIALFIPFGILYPLNKDASFKRSVLCGFTVSLVIEVIQFLMPSNRIADVTDLINNVLGTAIGAFLYCFIIRKYLLKHFIEYDTAADKLSDN